MPQARTMSLDQKLSISNKALALWKDGDTDGYRRLMQKLPIPPYLAKIAKEKIGENVLAKGGWDLSETEAECGQDWHNR
ncbi:MAG: hypothetical protein FWC36_05385 [Spirochaetes bacterium]|nr:hypothetical protein [Spirochaetota bacterium]